MLNTSTLKAYEMLYSNQMGVKYEPFCVENYLDPRLMRPEERPLDFSVKTPQDFSVKTPQDFSVKTPQDFSVKKPDFSVKIPQEFSVKKPQDLVKKQQSNPTGSSSKSGKSDRANHQSSKMEFPQQLQNNEMTKPVLSETNLVKDEYNQYPSLNQNSSNNISPSLSVEENRKRIPMPKILSPNGSVSLPLSKSDLSAISFHQRAKREFVPEEKKDNGYWNKRLKNNDSARRSRVKRKAIEKLMETQLLELQEENIQLRHELDSLKKRLKGESFSSDSSQACSSPRVSDKTSNKRLHREVDSDDQRSSPEGHGHSEDSAMFCAFNSIPELDLRKRSDSIESSTSSMGSACFKTNVKDFKTGSHFAKSSNIHSFSRQYADSPYLRDARHYDYEMGGALDLTSERSNMSSPSDESSPESYAIGRGDHVRGSPGQQGSPGQHSPPGGEAKETKFPLKCRLKRSLDMASEVVLN